MENYEKTIEERKTRLQKIADTVTHAISFKIIVDIATAKLENEQTDTQIYCKINNYPYPKEGEYYE